uniref:Uncharacterized protein n=1 Tax=Noctiluca scintillans TaxID=2966 RepID=A0A7S0ZVA1_NOCSC|mmetsp:Transcript_20420/g.54700  ORF Transcript_20420/g.54700 Transcript_20420/m.54700 type:complete len:157 (+) Transcript_20420:38-508(+)
MAWRSVLLVAFAWVVRSDRDTLPLIWAAGEGASEQVQELLDAGHSVSERTADGESTLHVAAIQGDIATVRALLAARADVNARTNKGKMLSMTPLHWAIYHGHKQMVLLLLQSGADPLAADENGKTPLEMCSEAGQDESAKFILDAIRERELAASEL